MRFGVLGPLVVWDDSGAPLDVGGRQPRTVLSALLYARGGEVSTDGLVDVLWGDDPPTSAINTIHSYISRLRRVVSASGGAELVLHDGGYRLVVDPEQVDVDRFERLVADGQAQIGAGHVREARQRFASALELWRGDAFPELADHGPSLGEIARLDELRLATLDARLDADLSLGRHAPIVAELHAVVAEHPYHEPFAAKLALALYRSDRQVDALDVVRDASRRLREELGVSPGRQLVELETAILNQDCSLDAPRSVDARPEALAVGAEDAPSTFVGRRDEFRRLRSAFHAANTEGRIVVIEGEPGIGKTRLASELERHAAALGSSCAWGRNDESGTAPALWPWLAVIRQLAAVAPDRAHGVIALLEHEAPMIGGRGPVVRYQCFDAVAELLETTGELSRPMLVVLDDLQWADATSLHLLQFLAQRPLSGVCIVATVRPSDLGQNDDLTTTLSTIARRSGTEHLRLEGLDRDEIATLANMIAPGTETDGVVDELHETAGGNPFYAIELARLLARSGDFTGGIPSTIRDTVRRRLAGFPEPTMRLLELAATIGREFSMSLLASAADEPVSVCANTLEPALRRRILISSGPATPDLLAFGHALIRQVLLDGVSDLRRADLHLKVADALDEGSTNPDTAEILAEHLWRSVLIGDRNRAADALEAAAEVAIRRVAYPTAESLLHRSTKLRRTGGGSDARQRAELRALMRLLEVMQATRYFSGTDRDVLARAEELAERADLHDVVRTLQWYDWSSLAVAADAARHDGPSERFFERWIRDERPEVRAMAHAVRGVGRWSAGRIVDAIESFDAARTLIAQAPAPADAFEAESRLVMHTFSLWNHAAHGDQHVHDVFDGYRKLLDTWPELAAPSICGFASSLASVLGCWEDLAFFVEQTTRADPNAQFAFWGGQAMMYRAMLTARTGDIDDGLALFTEGRHRYRSVGARSALPSFEAIMGEIAIAHGRPTEGSELVATARRRLTATREHWNESIVATAEAAVAKTSGSTRRMAERLDTAARVAAEQGAAAFVDRANRRARDLQTT